jgi:pentatricopeptide repeat protein
VILFNRLIQALARTGRVDEMMITYRQMKESGMSIDLIVYALTLRTLWNKGRMAEATEVFHDVQMMVRAAIRAVVLALSPHS